MILKYKIPEKKPFREFEEEGVFMSISGMEIESSKGCLTIMCVCVLVNKIRRGGGDLGHAICISRLNYFEFIV